MLYHLAETEQRRHDEQLRQHALQVQPHRPQRLVPEQAPSQLHPLVLHLSLVSAPGATDSLLSAPRFVGDAVPVDQRLHHGRSVAVNAATVGGVADIGCSCQ